MKKLKVIPVIPALNPDDKLVNYVSDLIKIGFSRIIIIDDGSSSECKYVFNALERMDNCIVIRHAVNQGKGRALKTAFNYYLNSDLAITNVGIVTADSDGQHSAQDTYNVAKSLLKNKDAFVLGTRNFNSKNVPVRSKFGNKTTTIIFKLLYGKMINDTQTGLRAIPNSYIYDCLKMNGEKYDFEINMLIKAVQNNMLFKEEIIETIYIDDNKSSHFNPVIDSLRIYKVMFSQFIKFGLSGFFSFALDIVLFWCLINFIFNFKSSDFNIIFSSIFARMVSSLVNFNLNKKVVFNCKCSRKSYLVKYYSLCVIQLCLSACLTSLLFRLNIFDETICKLIIDICLFFVSYNIQRKYIFREVKC